MRIGFDIDGVLADFNSSFIEDAVRVTGRDLFPPRPFDIPCWDYPQHSGYTEQETDLIWSRIVENPHWWLSLDPYEGTRDVLERLTLLDFKGHDIYFITSRPGKEAKHQTEMWLRHHGFQTRPTVLISSAKGLCAEALNLGRYVDDRDLNVVDVRNQRAWKTDVYLVDRPWNRTAMTNISGITRVTSPLEVIATV